MTRSASLALLCVLAMSLAIPLADPAPTLAAKGERRLCADRANLYDTPGGFVVGRLYRPVKVRVLRRSANRRWVHVRTRTGLAGWLTSGALCRA
ncbi:MAG TPA: SH3 domain-containing protein [Solirubrobacteraceae bacterium]|nr:SH3 domain-containing protein [Solirubrobacteraceae bacterium]